MRVADPAFWGKPEDSQKQLLKRRSQLDEALQMAEQYKSSLGDLAALMELQDEGEDVTSDLQQELSDSLHDIAIVLEEAFRVLRDDAVRAHYLQNLQE